VYNTRGLKTEKIKSAEMVKRTSMLAVKLLCKRTELKHQITTDRGWNR